jgi:hypothetical protein
MNLITVNSYPEFGYELACTLPYAYYLYKNNMLKEIQTVIGMKPFYYFFDNVKEIYNYRSVDNKVSMKGIPNNWLAHNALALTGKDYSELTKEEKLNVNGVLDYREWVPPPLKDYYLQNNELDFQNKFIIISNVFCMSHAEFPVGYFDVPVLQEMFEYLLNKGYIIIYKRPENTEFALDINEQLTVQNNLLNKYGIKVVDDNNNILTDKQVCKLYKNVYLMDDILKKYPYLSYNEFQLKLFSKAHGFISYGGGNSIFSCYFKSPVISYVTGSAELRENYFNKNCFYRKLSGAEIYPIKDPSDEIIKRGYRNYNELLNTIKQVF